MATLSVKTIASDCLGKSAPLSLKRDIFGVYGNNPAAPTRSLKTQLDLIQNKPFVRLAIVTILGANPNLQRDVDNTNGIYQIQCDAWVYCVGSITVNRPNLLVLDQDSCPLGVQANPTAEEDELFDLGRNMGADLVAYYIQSGPGGIGCSAYPAGRRGFWADDGASPWTFAHELVHIMGLNPHSSNSDNLLFEDGTFSITNLPPDLTNTQRNQVLNDPSMESC